MSTIVYQGFQSSSESHIIETTTLKLKVPTPTPTEFGRSPCIESNMENLYEKYQDTKKCSSNKNADLAGWSSLQNLPTVNSLNPKLDSKEKENSYVHPLSKQPSSSRLSEKSLALCTENLGCETGTDHIIESSIFSFSSDESNTVQAQSSATKTDIRVEYTPSSTTNYKVITNTESCRKLPPPLTTLRGSNSLQVSTHREGGRLIIKAVEVPKVHTYLQAERSNGRLQLCFLKEYGSSASKLDLLETTDDENEELKAENGIFESDISNEEDEDYEEEEDMEEGKDEEEEESGMNMDMNGNSYDVEVEIGIGNCQRIRRCKEGRKGNKNFCDWRKPLWVATS
ncbi:protein FANTASTIC FOUR 3-like [Nicotiana tomentosiformis]|uniref:protein FANTASTIC FOUR 3-like n=1 Tax=Nicotiana tomentosiformis TaxID=4098 RepID=UPI00051ADC4D|nr:protein FANTASTIC FOUR 3-like [Nicotiana tomentosiformis]